jgi:hypothetical protein
LMVVNIKLMVMGNKETIPIRLNACNHSHLIQILTKKNDLKP